MKRIISVFIASLFIYGCGGGGSSSNNVTTPPAISVSLSPSTQTTLDIGQTVALTATLTNDSSAKGVTWTLSGTGCTGAACGTLTNTTTTTATYNTPASVSASLTVTVTATSASDTTKSATATLVANPAPSITTKSLVNGMVGTAYSATLAATGGTGTLTWTVASGSSLPAGLSMSSSGAISGTPTAAGPATFTVKVTDAASTPVSVSQPLTITINPLPISVSLSPATQTTLDQGQTLALTATLTNDSGSKGVTWTVSGTGCSGAACGTLANTTTTTATYNTPAVTASLTVTVTATSVADSTKMATATVIVNPPPSITTTSLANGLVGTAYSATLAATGGTGTLAWTVASGSSLPAGLSMSSSGAISGTPTAAGPSTFTVKVTDGASTPVSATQALSVTIYSPLTISTAALPGGAVGVAYSQTIASSGGTAPITWSWTSLTAPPGLQLGPTGASTTVSGTPTQAGPYTFTVTATDSSSPAQSAKQAYSVTIAAPLSITTTSSLPNGSVNATYSQPITATGGTGTLTWSLATGTLPTGLTLGSSGTISGTPTYPGSSSFSVMVTDSGTPPQTKTQAFSLTIDGSVGGTLSISTTSLPAGTINVPYTGSIAVTGGTPSYAYTAAGLPAGLSLNPTTGQISGTPTATGTTSFTVSVTDKSLPPQTAGPQLESITINGAGTGCSSAGNEPVLSGQYTFTLSGFNGSGFLAVAGAFTADGTGKITGGEADANGVLGFNTSAIDPTQSSYSVGGDNRGCATIATTFGTFTTRFDLGSISGTPTTATKGNLMEFEPASSSAYIASGQILQQNTALLSGGLSGSYILGYTGWDFEGSKPTATAGAMTTGTGQTITSAELDQNDGGNLTNYPDISGSYTNFDSYGRSTATLSSTSGTFTLVFYMVSGSNLNVISLGGSPQVLGQAQQQTVPTGGFTDSSINGKMVVYGSGASSATAGDSFIGIFNSTGSGGVGISLYDDKGANNSGGGTGWETTLGTATTDTCSYTVGANGRMTLSGLSGPDPNCSGAPLFYLTGSNAAVLIGQGSSVDFGWAEPQANITFNSGTLSGIFFTGPLEVVSQGQETEVDQVAFASPTATFTIDSTSTAGPQQIDISNPVTYTVNADGTVSTVQGGFNIVLSIIINSNRFVMINEVPDVYPYIMIGQQ